MTATIHALIPTAKLRCEGCGTLADAACGCGVGYLPVKASDAKDPIGVEVVRMWAEWDGRKLSRYHVSVKVAYRQKLAAAAR